MQLMKNEDRPVIDSRPFVVATLPLPPGINASYKIVTVAKKNTEPPTSYTFNGHRVYGMPDARTSRRTVNRLGATEELQDFKNDAATCMRSLDMATVSNELVDEIREKLNRKKVVHVPLELTIYIFYSSLWSHDEDGPIKAIQDAVFEALRLNDNLVVDLHVHKRKDKENPRVEIKLCLSDFVEE